MGSGCEKDKGCLGHENVERVDGWRNQKTR